VFSGQRLPSSTIELSHLFTIFGTMLDLKTIETKVNKGEVFFISDFTELGNYEAVRKSL
jgi:hypothetical protein